MATDAKIPSHMRSEPGSHNTAFAKWPDTAKTTEIDASAIAKDVVERFNKALSGKDITALVGLFLEENSYWRDHLANSWDLRTLKGRNNIQKFLQKSCRLQQIELDTATPFRAPHIGAFDGGNTKGVEFFVNFETSIGKGQGVVRLAEQDDRWQIWSLFLCLKEITGHEEPLRHNRATGVAHGAAASRKSWLDRRLESESFTNNEPAVLIVGAGQGGLTTAARLKMLNVPSLIIDLNDRIGDNWRKRYSQLVLHDPVYYDHMPYLNFPPYWPIFTPKDKLADWFETYAKSLELNVWMKTKLTSSTWDANAKTWTVTVTRTLPDGTVETRTLHPRHIIQATGHSGKKNLPSIPGMSDFKGLLVHSSEHTGANPLPQDSTQQKHAIVVGACNSAHDIAQDYHEQGYAVTMVQRSSTCVVTSTAIMDIGLKGLYDEDSPPADDADLWLFAYPAEAFKSLQLIVAGYQADHDKQLLDGLEARGFKTDKGPDDGGLFIKYFQRGGGYYIDVGGSQLIVDGKVKVKNGEIASVTPTGLEFVDGSSLQADEIVFATGYQNMRTEARSIFGDDVYEKIDSVWGMNEEGEFRTVWQKSGHPGFWLVGGNLALCRYFSRMLALQIKGLEEGLYSLE